MRMGSMVQTVFPLTAHGSGRVRHRLIYYSAVPAAPRPIPARPAIGVKGQSYNCDI